MTRGSQLEVYSLSATTNHLAVAAARVHMTLPVARRQIDDVHNLAAIIRSLL